MLLLQIRTHGHGLKFLIFRPKYRISVTTEAKSVMENRLREKSLKNWKFLRYIGIGPKFR